ncbi:thiopeptide-type bacteriocin biosynthesis protein [Chitinophaga nivalis]|uniref:Thiopeptide-type bacteriocin biosynthesis protein n=1 Tax=Chitinophaga nivalis TaxID=2991709 RepID=A0ABT3II49_9BACT|nr:thiopeptide-type bacteriocin biosynthesis protein [Chitinophaga nivalis]MCW3466695.1 thiopeptide-type bacteriocin biosynthesis protein [Chitinophaga nivalis]MCW3483614.1 thiopeptide-type bacteriocin biosynthesis protein [Chitinophaga nivalis]
MNTHWLSAHLFYNGNLNLLLQQLVSPFLQEAQPLLRPDMPYFFIRYNEGGPHIRLRLQVSPHREYAVKDMLAQYVRTFTVPDPDIAAPVLSYIDYIPETDRYGDARTLPLAEEIFYLSSAVIRQWIDEKQTWDYHLAFSSALQLHTCFFYALQGGYGTFQRICEGFIAGWLPRLYDPARPEAVQQMELTAQMESRYEQYKAVLQPAILASWEALQQKQADVLLQTFTMRLTCIFQRYRKLITQPAQLEQIARSLLHMTHNRLGIANMDEAYIMYLTLKSMAPVYDDSGLSPSTN